MKNNFIHIGKGELGYGGGRNYTQSLSSTGTCHHIVEPSTKLLLGDYVKFEGGWWEIWHITEENGIHLSNNRWICRADLY